VVLALLAARGEGRWGHHHRVGYECGVIRHGINMLRSAYDDAEGIRASGASTPIGLIIVGAVIMLAVVIDQVVHILQAERRLRQGAAASAKRRRQPAADAGTRARLPTRPDHARRNR